jgi:hypothetical protein
MKLNCQSSVKHGRQAFTLAEVVAALLFMAIVIPVAVEGLRIASAAGEMGLRKADAARVAERLLAESLITSNWSQAMQNGTVYEADREYRWRLRNENWSEDAMQLLSLEVTYSVQGQDRVVTLSTLAPSN